MIENTKCECGHQNHIGTVLCESCGKPLLHDQGQEPLEMRYDGTARRSQRANKNVIDYVWSFFSSVKVAIYLIVITLCLASLGTIYPQEDTFIGNVDFAQWYGENYGWTGTLYHALGLSHTYESWWFKALIVMIGTSLVVCSLDRVLPLYRALSKQKIRKHPQFILRQKVKYEGALPQDSKGDAWLEQFQATLEKKRYKVHVEDGALLAEKGRFSRWGPYINHIGLILFLLAVLARSIPGWYMEEYVWALEHETVQLADTPYYFKNEKFTLEFYNQNDVPQQLLDQGKVVAKTYRVDGVLYECTANCGTSNPELQEVMRDEIEVNYPLKYKDLNLYLVDYEASQQLLSMNLHLKRVDSDENLGSFVLDMKDPSSEYVVGDYQVRIEDYYPELTIRNGVPATNSRDPKNPAFILRIMGPSLPSAGETYFFVPMMGIMSKLGDQGIQLTDTEKGLMELRIESEDDVVMSDYRSFLSIRKDRAISYIWIGAAISMIGLIMGFYWQHRRIWLRIDGQKLSIGAHTNKNWFGLRKELAAALNKNGLEVDPKFLTNEVKK